MSSLTAILDATFVYGVGADPPFHIRTARAGNQRETSRYPLPFATAFCNAGRSPVGAIL
ncbi:hypothetical protein NTGM5_890038 [Candidatus Nitrotoga sp. M5]|nr:hypothetical protein NTGM5_890011 [Candidatus Nitrotoga sp. M5]CAH1388323.1 hypothetical protein NTGM5_890038 [Candidatus Nitrotoga sp. M5]